MRQFRIIDLVAAASLALVLGAACDSGDKPKEEATAPAAEAKPDEAKPDAAKPDEPKPDEAKPDEAKPDEAKPDEAAGDAPKPDEAAGVEAQPDEPEPEPEPEAKPAAKKPAAKDKAAGAAIDGKPLFLAKCKSCHGEDGKGKTKFAEKTPVESLSKTKLSKAKIVDAITNGVPDTKMKPFKDKLSKEEIEAIAAYVKKL